MIGRMDTSDAVGPMREILSLARWAPSGDNTQPWRFEVLSQRHLRVHGFDTRDHCVYDLDGRPSRLSVGALLETLGIAASVFGLRARIEREAGSPETSAGLRRATRAGEGLAADPLAAAIEHRCVQRRPLSTRPLSEVQKRALEAAVGPGHELIWFEGLAQRRAMAALMFRSARIRLTIEEAYRVHASVIQWKATSSEDRIPDAAVGLDPVSLVAMRWVMGSWPRARFVARYLGGTLAPRVQLDLIPGLLCGAHVVIARAAAQEEARSDRSPGAQRDILAQGDAAAHDLDADFAAGRAVQRFWLTAETLGLRHQPEMTPLIFSRYAAEGRRFTNDEGALRTAQAVRESLDGLLGAERRARAVWIGRIGAGPRAQARSVRLPLDSLLIHP